MILLLLLVFAFFFLSISWISYSFCLCAFRSGLYCVWSARVSLNWKISYLSVQHAWVYFFHLFFFVWNKKTCTRFHTYTIHSICVFSVRFYIVPSLFVNVLFPTFGCIVWINACETEYSLQEPMQVKICNSRLIPLLSNVQFLFRFYCNFTMTIQFSDTKHILTANWRRVWVKIYFSHCLQTFDIEFASLFYFSLPQKKKILN